MAGPSKKALAAQQQKQIQLLTYGGVATALLVGGIAAAILLEPQAHAAPPGGGGGGGGNPATISISASVPAGGQAPFSETFTGIYTPATGTGAANRTIYLIVNGTVESSTTTDSAGNYSITWVFAQAGTEHCLTADNIAASTANGGAVSTTLTIPITGTTGGGGTPAFITLNPLSNTVNVGGSVPFSGKVTDANGAGVGGVTLYGFEGVGGGTQTLISNLTIPPTASDGSFGFTLTFMSAGSFQINVANNTSDI